MKNCDTDFINKIKYSDNIMAKKILRKAKVAKWTFFSMLFLETIVYLLIIINKPNINVIILYSFIYLIFAIYFCFRYVEYSRKKLTETIKVTVCPEGFLNVNLYNAKSIVSTSKSRNYSLNNIAYAYVLMGDFEKANEIIDYIDKKKNNILVKTMIIQNRIEISFYENDKKEFAEQHKKIQGILKFNPRKYKNEVILDLKIKEAIFNKDEKNVNELCDKLEKRASKFELVKSAYYRALVLENNKKESKEYYKITAEKGNNIYIANKSREKIELDNNTIVYKEKMHVIHKIANVIIFLILSLLILTFSIFTAERPNIKWDTGEIYIGDNKILIPSRIDEFESKINIKIGEKDEYNFSNVIFEEGKIDLYIEDNTIKGLKIDKNNISQDKWDKIIFPNNITLNKDIGQIEAEYKTGTVNVFMQEVQQLLEGQNIRIVRYIGGKYNIEFRCVNNEVQTIAYVYNM